MVTTSRAAQRAPDLAHAEEDQRPDQVELLFHGQGPRVDQRRGETGHVEVVGTGENEVPVGEIEKGGERITSESRIGAGGNEQAVDDGDTDEHDEEGWKQPPSSASPKGPELDGAALSPLDDQQRGDEEPGEGKEAVEEEEAAGGQEDTSVHTQNAEHSYAPDPVKCRLIGKRCTLPGSVWGDAGLADYGSVVSSRESAFAGPGYQPMTSRRSVLECNYLLFKSPDTLISDGQNGRRTRPESALRIGRRCAPQRIRYRYAHHVPRLANAG